MLRLDSSASISLPACLDIHLHTYSSCWTFPHAFYHLTRDKLLCCCLGFPGFSTACFPVFIYSYPLSRPLLPIAMTKLGSPVDNQWKENKRVRFKTSFMLFAQWSWLFPFYFLHRLIKCFWNSGLTTCLVLMCGLACHGIFLITGRLSGKSRVQKNFGEQVELCWDCFSSTCCSTECWLYGTNYLFQGTTYNLSIFHSYLSSNFPEKEDDFFLHVFDLLLLAAFA